jgi:two-component system sensor histidine kinase RegB
MSVAVAGSSDEFRINFSWLVRLRWGVIIGQAVFVSAVHYFMNVPLPLVALGSILAVEIATNLGCLAWLRRSTRVREHHVGSLVALDVVLFSLLLYFTGGPTNPFSFLYLIHIALAAVVLQPRWMWALVALALLCSALLFVYHVPLATGHAGHEHHDHGHDYGMHLRGMWLALAVAATFIVYFLQRVMRELSERDAELALAREKTAQHERLASLATLAAGAAHELASPLSTIAVVSKELERRLAVHASADEIADARLVREQVERCRAILSQMAADAGEPLGDVPRRLTPRELIATALEDLTGSERVHVTIAPADEDAALVALPRPLAQALRSLLKNALDASVADRTIDLLVTRAAGEWRLEVRDRGSGMTPEVEAHAVEPFFTTKPTGQGMGLGLFLSKSVAEQHGGRLEIRSRAGVGTRAALLVPETPPATICRSPAHV